MDQLFLELNDHGISISLDREDLLISYEGDTIPESLVTKIRENKTELIQYLKKYASEDDFEEIQPVPMQENYPISFAQKRLWVSSQYAGASLAYMMPKVIDLPGDLDLPLFEKAVNTVIERHESLRTVFKEDEHGEVRQWILPATKIGFKIRHLDFSQSEHAAQQFAAFVQEEAGKLFDLGKGPLIRACLVKMPEAKYSFYYVMHHIITDGWSMGVLAEDAIKYYEAYQRNETPAVPALEIQYKDYAVWQIGQLKSGKYDAHKEYWIKKLKEPVPPIDLPGSKTRPRVKSHNGEILEAYLSKELTAEIKKFTLEQEGSLFITLLAIWNVLLYRYTQQEEIIVGSSVAGRNHASLENQIGFFVNTLALKNTIDPRDVFEEVYRKIKNDTFDAYTHQDYPFDLLVEDLQIERDNSRNILFDIVLVGQNAADLPSGFSIDEHRVNAITSLGKSNVKFDLEIGFFEYGDNLLLNIYYNTDVYERRSIETVIRHFRNLCSQLVSSKEAIGKINFLGKEEQAKLLVEFNDTATRYPEQKTVLSLFEEQVQKDPAARALLYNDTVLTYGELDEASSRLAAKLKYDMGVQPGELVAIMLERSHWVIVSILGILKSGAAFVPVDPAYPRERIDYILADSAARVLIGEKQEQLNENGPQEIKIILPDELERITRETSTVPEWTPVNPQQPAYVIYTSGSTGMPKGCQLTHANLFNYIQWANEYYFKEPGTGNWALITSFSFDLTFTSIFTSLTRGRKLWIGDAGKDISVLLQECFTHPEIDTLKLTPTHLTLVKAAGIEQTNIERIICGGEQLTFAQLNAVWEIKNSIKIYNEYGPTEATVGCIVKEIRPDDDKITIGKPVANTEIYILDQFLQPCPFDVPGEIYISGAGLSLGYLNQPELTGRKFISNPFKAGTKMYKTGDLGKWSADGDIEYLGRSDDQVKIKGYRIELGEIEYHLEQKEGISQAVVLVNEANELKELVAYIVSGSKTDITALRIFLSERLPEYMIPAYFIQLDQFPLSPNGKLDKKALPSIDAATDEPVEFVAPQTKEEKLLAKIWQGVLKKEDIGMKSNFYHLGGDSIKSILVVSRLKKEGYSLKLSDILESPVLEDLVLHMNTLDKVSDQSEVSGEIVLTPVQQYFFQFTGITEHHHYNQSVVLKSSSAINLSQLDQCLSFLVKHHDVLRMKYKKEGEGWKQFNAAYSSKSYECRSYDLSGETNALEQINQIGGELQAQFDLSEGPLFKAAHFKTADGEYLALVIHHLVVDGVSWRILLEDLLILYSQVKNGMAFKLPLKSDSFQKWATAQKELASAEKIVSEIGYWKEVCNMDIPELKTDLPVSGKNIFDKKIQFTLDSELTGLLKTGVNDKYNTEINDLLLTGLGMALKATFGVEKSMIKMEGHGREDIIEGMDISRTVGWFTSIYPVVLDVSNTHSHAAALVQVKENLRRIPNKGIGYGMLKYLNGSYNDLSFVPSVIFNYLGEFSMGEGNGETSEFQYASVAIGDNISKNNREEVLLDVSGSIAGNCLTIGVSFSGMAFHDDTINKLAESYKTALAGLIRELLSDTEIHKTPSDLTYKKLTVHELNLVNADNNIEDIYELSPLQQGIYFHWLKDGAGSQYFEQLSYRVQLSNINLEAIEQAYTSLVNRHAILRTGFSNNLADMPLQIVRKTVTPGFLYKKLPGYVQEENIPGYIKEFKLADIAEGFDLAHHSLMRLKILGLGNDRFEFVWSHHHILMDGWCMGILINDFNLLLQAITQGKEADLPKPLPYSNYINWLNKINVNTSLAYWKQYLEDYSSVASVPFVKNTNEAGEYKDATRIIKFEGELHTRLGELCNSIGITQNTFIQAVWGYVLSKYNNTSDVVFGGVVSGRPAELPGVEDMVGLFINTIPVRVRYNGDDTPLTLFRKLKEDAISGNAHHYISLAKIQNQSELGSELINNIIVFENYLVKDAGENGVAEQPSRSLAVESVDVFEQTNYDFNILVSPSAASLQVCFKFNSNKYEESLVAAASAHFYTVAEQFMLFKDKPLTQIGLLPGNELQVLEQFNATQVEYEPGKTILDLFSETVQQYSEEHAVSYKGETFTYRELGDRSGQLANYLREQYNVQPGDLVGVNLERSERMILSILGVLKSGGGYVPLDTQYPRERVVYIKADSGCKVCIDEEFLEVFNKEKDNYKTVVENVKVLGNNTAYAIYTSGSTGNPKGVLNEHAGLYNRLLWMRDDLGIDASDVILQKTPYTFDVSVWELLMPSITGCRLVFAEPEGHKDPAYLQDVIESDGITIMHFVPSMLGIFLEELDAGKCKSLRHVVCSGEALPAVMVEEFKQKLPWVRIHNLYGPTEAGIDVTSIDLTEVDTKEHGVTIGKPVANTKIYIVDKYMSLQPVGVPGELLIEGIQVARGYLNRPELTAEKFIESPFTKGDRIYRTGDLAKWLPDGSIAYIGRIDNQVKIRGNRIELGEIETRINESGLVEQAAVLVQEDASSRKYLAAYIIPGEGYVQEALFSYLRERLPEYMIPGVVMEMETFPLTSSGKLNRKALPEPGEAGITGPGSYEAPRDEMEMELATIWAEVLRLEKVGINDNFFRIGGDSIVAIRLVSRINKKFNVTITIAQLYRSNNIKELKGEVEKNVSSPEENKKIRNDIRKSFDDLMKEVLENK